MPRKSSTAATLEAQAAADSEIRLGDLDENGLERLPEFGPELSHEDKLADLDARDDRLNGVRPSEQCGIVAGSGPFPCKRCTYAEHPMNQPHSWEVLNEPPAEQPGHVYDDAEQATLPGTPEPDVDAYSIPFESQFNNADFQAAPGIEEIADRLINETEDFAHLIGLRVRYFWKRRGGTKGGNPRLAALTKPGGLSAYALGRPQFALRLAADHCREAKLTREQMNALVFDMLCRARQDPNDHDQYRVVGSDFEGMIATVQRFGFWHPDLREFGANVKQLGLLDSLPDVVEDDLDDAEDGEDEE